MKAWFQKFSIKMQKWMYGRYGYDELSRFLMITACVLMILSIFLPLLYPFALGSAIWSVFRMYSKNIGKRRNELRIYFKHKKKVIDEFKLMKNKLRDRKTHKYFKCPNCKSVLRVPKDRGEIIVTCPNCKCKTEKKT